MPETMPDVENYLIVKQEKEKSKELQKKINSLRTKILEIRMEKKDSDRIIWDYSHSSAKPAYSKTEFKRPCPADGCRGFLSSQWRCGMCEIWVCRKCLEIKGHVPKGIKPSCAFTDHICNPDSVKTAALIKKETKNCPNCAIPIFKIFGCDQMWCTQCHIAFSWATGRKVNGVIHNPHFYQWQQEGGGAPIHAPAAIVCGGVPEWYSFRMVLSRWGDDFLLPMRAPGAGRHAGHRVQGFLAGRAEVGADTTFTEIIINLYRRTQHFQNVELPYLRARCQNITDNKELRIRYIIKDISETDIKRSIMKRDKAKEKNLAALQIYELLSTIFTESLRDIHETGDNLLVPQEKKEFLACVERVIDRCNKVRRYANTELSKISNLYNQNVDIIRPDYSTISTKITCDTDNIDEFYG